LIFDFLLDTLLASSDKFIALFSMVIMSLFFRELLVYTGQSWIRTTSHTSTILLLPIITYVVTNVISGNIALSLGMVGALSIVRFRNPVRSPLELVVYFGSITMGIAAAVSMLWLSFFGFSVVFSLTVLYLFGYIYRFFNKSYFTTSFTEGNNLSTLEVMLSENNEFLDNNKFLTLKKFQNNQYFYILSSHNFTELSNTAQKINELDILIDYQLTK